MIIAPSSGVQISDFFAIALKQAKFHKKIVYFSFNLISNHADPTKDTVGSMLDRHVAAMESRQAHREALSVREITQLSLEQGWSAETLQGLYSDFIDTKGLYSELATYLKGRAANGH
jgi:hypothetical protein